MWSSLSDSGIGKMTEISYPIGYFNALYLNLSQMMMIASDLSMSYHSMEKNLDSQFIHNATSKLGECSEWY